LQGFDPGAEPGIFDFRAILPEAGSKSATNAEMVELDFDESNAGREIAFGVSNADVESGNSASSILRHHNHEHQPSVVGEDVSGKSD
jgi:hypothetical protein